MSFNQDSIFGSALRSLCNALCVVLGVFIAFIFIGLFISFLSPQESLPQKSELTISADADGHRQILPQNTPVVLRINLDGVIGMNDLTAESFQNMLYDSQEAPLQNRVKALFLYVNTPGGTADDAAAMYHALLAYKKQNNIPVYAFVQGLCASGGMYVCAAADKIYATDTSVIGSIGVLSGPMFNVSDLMAKAGVQSLTVTAGKDKDMLNPFRPWKTNEDASLACITKDLYEQFVTVVTEGRPNLDRKKLIEDYGAHVFLANKAQELGYIDVASANYALAMKDLITHSEIKDQTYQVITLSTPSSFLSQLTQSKFSLFSGKIEHTIQLGPYMDSSLSGKLLYLYQP